MRSLINLGYVALHQDPATTQADHGGALRIAVVGFGSRQDTEALSLPGQGLRTASASRRVTVTA
jgi:hypothetical protein